MPRHLTVGTLLSFFALLCSVRQLEGREKDASCKRCFPSFLASWLLGKFGRWKIIGRRLEVRWKRKARVLAPLLPTLGSISSIHVSAQWLEFPLTHQVPSSHHSLTLVSPTFPPCFPSLKEGSGFVPLLFSGLSSLPQFALAAFPASSHLIPWTELPLLHYPAWL